MEEILRVWMSNSSADWCREECHLEIAISRIDFLVHSGSWSAYTRPSCVGEREIYVQFIYLSTYSSIAKKGKQGDEGIK